MASDEWPKSLLFVQDGLHLNFGSADEFAQWVTTWWLRQLLRDVRTHEHFSEDAAERATMIETYAALRGTGLQDADLSPILTALYRPAAGGLSEDQGPILPTEIILKTVAAAATKAK